MCELSGDQLIKRLLFTVCALLAIAIPAAAQNTTQVSAQVIDPNGWDYSGATATIQLSTPGATVTVNNQAQCSSAGAGAAPCQIPINGQAGSATLDAFGKFAVTLYPNASIQPANTKWVFTINYPGTAPPIGTGGQTFSVPITIAGATQNISSTLTAAAPIIINATTGSTGVTSLNGLTGALTIAAGANVTVTPSGGNTLTIASTASGGGAGLPQFASYVISISGSTTSALNQSTGAVDYSGTDAAVVINDVLIAQASLGGTIFFKNGVYPINSVTTESECPTTMAWGIGIPSNALASSVQWNLVGESAPFWLGESASTSINTSGVIFNVTPTAVASVASTVQIMGIFQRPATGSSCTMSAASVSNDLFARNIGVRFPTNQRGNEVAFNGWFADDVDFQHTLADFNLSYHAIAVGSAPVPGTHGLIGHTSSVSSAGNVQYFQNTYSVGYDLAYDFQSEHIVSDTSTAIYSNTACEFGRSGTTVYHPEEIRNFVDQENVAGCIFGPQMATGGSADMFGYDIETSSSGWYARTTNLTETTPGNTNGIITYTTVAGGGGLNANPALFSSGGNAFTIVYLYGGFGWLRPPNALTIGNLQTIALGQQGYIGVVTDGTTATDCSVGGGTIRVLCVSNGGGAWVPLN